MDVVHGTLANLLQQLEQRLADELIEGFFWQMLCGCSEERLHEERCMADGGAHLIVSDGEHTDSMLVECWRIVANGVQL